jgi:hypothetical protein
MIPAEGTKMTAGDELLLRLDRAQTVALVLGGAGLVVSLGAWVLVPEHFFTSYLVGYLFWIGITLGSIGLTMLHHLSGGSWGLVIRRPLEAGATTALALALLFLPIAFGLDRLFPWAVSGSPSESLVVEPSPYLNRTFFFDPRRRLLRRVDRDGTRACRALEPARPHHRPISDPMAPAAERSGQCLALLDGDVLGD